MPALAVAHALRAEEPGAEILLAGRAAGTEARLVTAAGFRFEGVHVRGLDRDAVWKNLALPALLPAALARGLRIVDGFKPDVVLGMGGYAMAPAVAAARLRRVADVLLEKDVRPGLATRLFAGSAAAVCTTLPGTEARLPGVHCVLTGVPVRQEFQPRRPEVPPRRLLIMGGSQGARRLNQAVWQVLDQLCERFEEVIHLAGRQGADEIAKRARPGYTAFAFSDEIPQLMGRADLVVSRAGVGAIAEAAVVGLPSILVPGTFGGRHQELNAKAVVEAGAAVAVPDAEFDGRRLLQELDALTPEELKAMAAAQQKLARPDAAARVLAVLREVAG